MNMCDQNPLHIPTPPAHSESKNQNRKGRPRKLETITFSAPPKSMVSQMIQRMIAQNNVILPIERHEIACNDAEPVEVDLTQDCSISEPKKMKPKINSCDFPDCTYRTKSSSNFHKHRRRHTEEKPYLCDQCSFRTNFSNSLKVHKRLHTTERPYQCNCCDYRCNSISNLKKHSLSRHKNKKKNKKRNNTVSKTLYIEPKQEGT